MKKRLLSLALAMALCVSLAVPALAADASSLDAATAKAYANALDEQIGKYGIISGYGEAGVQYADLRDMDADGSPELIVISYEDTQNAVIGVWTTKNGTGIRTVNASIPVVSAPHAAGANQISIASNGGRIYVCESGGRTLPSGEVWYNFYAADGTVDSRSNPIDPEGPTDPLTLEIEKNWTFDSWFLEGAGRQWIYNEEAVQTVEAVRSALMNRVNQTLPSAPTDSYGTFSVAGEYGGKSYVLTFDAAIVEKATITLGYDDPDYYDTIWESEQATLIKLRPGSNITIAGGDQYEGDSCVLVCWCSDAANFSGRYYFDGQSAWELYAGPVEKTFTDYFDGDLFCLLGASDENGNNYFIGLDTSTSTATPSTGFTDVSANAYYADAVTWAIGKGITNGTGTNTFSPENTCNNAEILTFIWRAKGQPEPTVSNPFSNVKSSDYYYKAALWAYQNGLVSGSLFHASTPCTRSMAVAYLWKAAGSPAAGASHFSDVPASASYAAAVAWAVNQGITNGDGANTFSPDKTCTRGQIVTFLYRALA